MGSVTERSLERFTADTSEHVMTVLHDEGVYRHVRYRNPKTNEYWYDLITTPGLLTINGDMGTFTFQRLEDMFAFFGSGPSIKPQYWSEKLVAIDRSGYESYSRQAFEQMVREHVEQYTEDLSDEDKETVNSAIEEELLGHWGLDDEREARGALDDFCVVLSDDTKFQFHDTWEYDFSEYTIHFLWCCHAIRWGIEQYRARQ